MIVRKKVVDHQKALPACDVILLSKFLHMDREWAERDLSGNTSQSNLRAASFAINSCLFSLISLWTLNSTSRN